MAASDNALMALAAALKGIEVLQRENNNILRDILDELGGTTSNDDDSEEDQAAPGENDKASMEKQFTDAIAQAGGIGPLMEMFKAFTTLKQGGAPSGGTPPST